jgi:hypothetical protein
MTEDRMTLVERLRNPAWKPNVQNLSDAAILVADRTRADMSEAATEIELLRSKIATYKDVIRQYRQRDLEANPTSPARVPSAWPYPPITDELKLEE